MRAMVCEIRQRVAPERQRRSGRARRRAAARHGRCRCRRTGGRPRARRSRRRCSGDRRRPVGVSTLSSASATLTRVQDAGIVRRRAGRGGRDRGTPCRRAPRPRPSAARVSSVRCGRAGRSSVAVGADAHVVAVDAVLGASGAVLVIGPVLDPLVPVVGERQAVVAFLRPRNGAAAIRRHDLDAQREGADAGVFFPSVLRADRTVVGEIARRRGGSWPRRRSCPPGRPPR